MEKKGRYVLQMSTVPRGEGTSGHEHVLEWHDAGVCPSQLNLKDSKQSHLLYIFLPF